MEVNKKRWLCGGTAAALALALAVAGIVCWFRTNRVPPPKTSIRIGVALYRGDDTFISTVRAALEERAKAYEQETGIKVVMDIVDAKLNQNTQNSQVERFISLGYDALCVNIVDRSAASIIIDKAMDAGIPVVFFNREPVEEDMNRWEKLYYVGADAKESAVLQGNILVEAYRDDPRTLDLNGDGLVSYVLLEGETSHQDSLIRTEWSIQTLKDGGVPLEKLTGGIANWERSQASAWMEQWLKEYPGQIELVICNNDDMALGAIDAMKREGVTKGTIKVVGIDGTPVGKEALESGDLFGTVESAKELYAKVIFDIAAANAMGQEIPEDIVLDGGKYYRCPQYALTGEK